MLQLEPICQNIYRPLPSINKKHFLSDVMLNLKRFGKSITLNAIFVAIASELNHSWDFELPVDLYKLGLRFVTNDLQAIPTGAKGTSAASL